MAMPRRYSENLKLRMVQRIVGPHGVSARDLAEEVGIHQTTLSQWVKDRAKLVAMKRAQDRDKPVAEQGPAPSRQRRPEDWTPSEKLQAVMEASQLSEPKLGEWLRSKGLHEVHLHQWQETVMSAAREALAEGKPKGTSAEGKRVKELERELRRKDKALAETAALLVLRKKADALWGDEDASMGLTNDDESSR